MVQEISTHSGGPEKNSDTAVPEPRYLRTKLVAFQSPFSLIRNIDWAILLLPANPISNGTLRAASRVDTMQSAAGPVFCLD